MMEWEQYFLKLAEVVALRSKDPMTQVGAVIVGKDNEIRSTGYNGFPRGIADDSDRWTNREEKYRFVEHAERNAIYNAARVGIPTDGCKIFMTGPPCLECARAIIQAGIKSVNYPKDHPFKHRQDWEASMLRAKNLLNEAFISVLEW